MSFPPSFAGATGLLAGTGAELLNGTLFAATDTALETKLAKWVPSLVDDLATVAALQSPQYTTLLRKTVLVSFLQNSTAGPLSLTDDTDAANIDNQVNFPADSVEIIFINLLGLTVQVKGEVVSMEAGEKYNKANVGCLRLPSLDFLGRLQLGRWLQCTRAWSCPCPRGAAGVPIWSGDTNPRHVAALHCRI